MRFLENLLGIGGTWFVGASALLAIGALVLSRTRREADRQRIGELAVAVTVAWMLLAVVPLPRLGWFDAGDPAPASTPEKFASAARSDVLERLAMSDERLRTSENSRGDATIDSLGLAAATPSEEPPPTTPAVVAPGRIESPSSRVASSTPMATLATSLAVAYLVGAALLALALLIGLARLRHVLRARVETPPFVEAMARRLGGPRRPWLRITAARCRPFCFGVRRPLVVLPAHLCREELAGELESVLRHELVHLARRDGVGQALLAVAALPLWPHPLYWWIRGKVRDAAEILADDAAAGARRETYARHLLRLTELDAGHVMRPAGALPVFESSSQLSRRIEMLVRRRNRLPSSTPKPRRMLQVAAAGAVLVCAVATFGTPLAEAGDREKEEIARLQVQIESLMNELTALREANDALQQKSAAMRRRPAGDKRTALYAEEAVEPIEPEEEPTPEPVQDPFGFDPAEPAEVEPPVEPRNPFLAIAAQDPVRVAARRPASSLLSAACVSLMTSLIDIDGALTLAKKQAERARRAAEVGAAGPADLDVEVEIETLSRKRELIRALLGAEVEMAVVELESARAKLEQSVKLAEKGFISKAELRGDEAAVELAQARLVVLQKLL